VYRDQLAEDTMSLFSSGGVYNAVQNLKFRDGLSDEVKTDFAKQQGLCMGYAKLIEKVAKEKPEYSNSFVPDMIDEADCIVDCNVDKYIGDAEHLLMELRGKMGPDLRSVYYGGKGVTMNGKFANMVYIVSMQIYARIEEQYQEYCMEQPTKMNCIVEEEISIATPVSDGTTTVQKIKTYTVHGILVIPDIYLTFYDQYVKNSFYFAGLTIAQNINIGTNYGTIDRDGGEYPIRVEILTALKDEGKIHAKTESILSITISNPNLMVATSRLVEYID
jgi:hypothetical protein